MISNNFYKNENNCYTNNKNYNNNNNCISLTSPKNLQFNIKVSIPTIIINKIKLYNKEEFN